MNSAQGRLKQDPSASGSAQGHAAGRNNGTTIVPRHYVLGESAKVPDEPIEVLAARTPSYLLAAETSPVAFIGREEELGDLTDWRDNQEHSIAVRLIHGPGGQGKTRLAARFRTMSVPQWRVVVARQESGAQVGPPRINHDREVNNDAGLLVVIDDAERWPDRDLAAVLNDPVVTRLASRIRILLLARGTGSWWEGLRPNVARGGVTVSERRLMPLTDSVDHRTLFTSAVQAFRPALGLSPDARVTVPTMGGEKWQTVLGVHMAALAAVFREQSPPSARAPADPRSPSLHHRPEPTSTYLLGRESAHWLDIHNSGRVSSSPDALKRVVFLATLAGPLTYSDAVRLLRSCGIESPDALVDDYRICYPASGSTLEIGRLSPDRLGEDLIGLSLPGHGVEDVAPDPWTPGLLAAVFGVARDADEPNQRTLNAVTTLVEVADRWEHVADRYLYPLLRAQPRLALAAGSSVLMRLARMRRPDFAALRAVEAALPGGRHLGMDHAIADLTVLVVDEDLPGTVDRSDQASLCRRKAERLQYAGRSDDALQAIQLEIALREELAKTVRFQRDLASALDFEGVLLYELGRHDEALRSGEKCISLIDEYTRTGGDGLDRILANALTNISLRYMRSGDLERALLAARRGVGTWTGIVEQADSTDPASDEELVNLARSWHNLAHVHLQRQEIHEARTWIHQTLTVMTDLAERSPERWSGDLARDLYLASRILARETSGQGEGVAHQAANLYLLLADVDPKGQSVFAVRAVSSLSSAMTDAGLATLMRARSAALCGLSERCDERSLSALAESFVQLGWRLADRSLWQETVPIVVRANELFSATGVRRKEHDSTYVLGLYLLALAFMQTGFGDRAAGAARRALEVRDELDVREHPGVVVLIGRLLDATGDPAGAATAFQHGMVSDDLDTASEAARLYGALCESTGKRVADNAKHHPP